jgi:DNA-binding transcriptional MocR family regulator
VIDAATSAGYAVLVQAPAIRSRSAGSRGGSCSARVVSHLLQQTAAQLLASTATRTLLAHAAHTYADRRGALLEALAGYGITGYGRTGLGVWVPLAEEVATVQQLLERGWAVSPGERYRFRTPPGIRVTTTGLQPNEAEELAAAMKEIMNSTAATYAG